MSDTEIQDHIDETETTDLFVDITTIITLISDICNDPTLASRFGMIENWKKINLTVYRQLMDELVSPVLPPLTELLEGGQLITTQSVINKVNELIDRMGTDDERLRKEELLTRIRVVDDDPEPSFMGIKGKKWNDVTKNLFGTSYSYGIPLVSGNLSIVPTLMDHLGDQYDDEMYIFHRARCFVGSKFDKRNVEQAKYAESDTDTNRGIENRIRS